MEIFIQSTLPSSSKTVRLHLSGDDGTGYMIVDGLAAMVEHQTDDVGDDHQPCQRKKDAGSQGRLGGLDRPTGDTPEGGMGQLPRQKLDGRAQQRAPERKPISIGAADLQTEPALVPR